MNRIFNFTDFVFQSYVDIILRQQKRSIATFLTPLDVCKVKDSVPREPLDADTDFKEGFSLKVPKPHNRFTPEQERFVKDYFDRGEESKSRKVQPEGGCLLNEKGKNSRF